MIGGHAHHGSPRAIWGSGRRQVLAAALLSAAALFVVACNKPKDATPEGAVREMVHATRVGNAVRSYALLAPASQRGLEKMARLATAQTGGRRSIKPSELLAVSLDPVRYEIGQIELVEQKGDRATVRLIARRKKAQELIELVRVKGRWRLLLPTRMFQQPAPTSQPASAPAAADRR